MRKLTALLLLIPMCLQANPIAIELQENDFVQGKLTQLAHHNLNLTIQFPDRTERVLLRDIFGEADFMFKAEQTGTAQFSITENQQPVPTSDFALTITRHVHQAQQVALPSTFENQRLSELSAKIQQFPKQKTELLDQFWQQVKQQGTPLIEPLNAQESRVTFLWKGAKENVRIWGGVSADHDFMQRFLDTDLWYRSYVVPNDTLVEYRFAPDIPTLPVDASTQRRALLSTAQADPYNPNIYFDRIGDTLKNTDRFNYYSVLKLPNAPKQLDLTPNANFAKGSIDTVIFDSKELQNKRRLFVYKPANFDPTLHYPVLYLFDGIDYLKRVPTTIILDNLIATQKIPPIVAVFIENPSVQSRTKELTANSKFAEILAEKIVPFVEKQQKINAKTRIIAGSSYGGLAAAYVPLNHSDVFANALVLSGSFWWSPPNTPQEQSNYIAYRYATQPNLPICFFISTGYYESGKSQILETSRHLKDVLIAKNYPVAYVEQSTAHGYLAWQGLIREGLITLLTKRNCH